VQPEVTAERTNSGMLIEVHAGSEHWTVRLPDGGEPNVESGQ